MITAAQLRAARGLMDWTRGELAEAAKISPETVKNIEHGIFRPQEETADRIVKAFAAHDVVFTENEGVQLRKDSVIRYEGVEGFKRFMDDVYEAAKDPSAHIGGSKPICVSNVDESLFIKYSSGNIDSNIKRMNEINNIKVRVLAVGDQFTEAPRASYLEYRWERNEGKSLVPFYVYGDKLAIIVFEADPAPQVIVIASALVAKAYREQFEILWKNAKPLKSI